MKILLAALGLLALSASASEPWNRFADIAYAQPRNEQQTLDVYAPPSGRHHPVIFWIHGGGWMYGDKTDLQHGSDDPVNRKPAAFCGKGFVFVSVEYRKVPAVTIDQMAGDIGRAIGWVHSHIQDYGGDPEAIFVMGHSAGAHLAALVCTDRTFLADVGLSFRPIKGCVPVDGDMYYPELQFDIEIRPGQLNALQVDFPSLAAQKSLSAVMHTFKGKAIPPFLLLHVADHPETHTAMQAEIMAQALRQAEAPVEVVACPGHTHDTLNAAIGLPDERATQAIFAFLDRNLKSVP